MRGWALHYHSPATETSGRRFGKRPESSKGQKTHVSVIDGVANDQELSELLSFKLKDLLNFDSHTQTHPHILSDVTSVLSYSGLASMCISQSVVSDALSDLKMGNSEGVTLLTNRFTCASSALSQQSLYYHNEPWSHA